MASISEGVPTHSGTVFKMAAIFQNGHCFFEVRTLKIIEITDFNDHSVDSYIFDNSKTEYWVCNFENPTWRPIVAIYTHIHTHTCMHAYAHTLLN